MGKGLVQTISFSGIIEIDSGEDFFVLLAKASNELKEICIRQRSNSLHMNAGMCLSGLHRLILLMGAPK